jgi:tRNA-2-methylthio-N6-dimethylallyladenosine synthase
LQEIVDLQRDLSLEYNRQCVGRVFEVLIEGTSARSENDFYGRNSQNTVIVFPKGDLKPGTYVNVKVTACTAATLIGTPVSE